MLLSLDAGVDSNMATIGLKAFPAALVGGLDSLPGAALGALIVAAAEIAAIQYVDPLLSDVVPFIVLLVILADPAVGPVWQPRTARSGMR